jgi:electron transport complex protein RnfD
MNMPANIPLWIVAVGALIAIGVAKMPFGGLGKNPFNPAIVARVFLLIAYPVQMTSFAQPVSDGVDATSGATPLAAVGESLKNGLGLNYDTWDMFSGNIAGSLGEVATLALLLGGAYLLFRRVITWHIPVAIFATVAIFSGILYAVDPTAYMSPVQHLFTGGLMLGAIFMATDYVTSPMSKCGMIIYGIGIGILTIVIRCFGAYPEGVSFAILIMNAVTPLINTYVKPKLFGEVKK